MKNIAIPIPKVGKLRIFELFPVVLAIAVTWIYGVIVTEGGPVTQPQTMTRESCSVSPKGASCIAALPISCLAINKVLCCLDLDQHSICINNRI